MQLILHVLIFIWYANKKWRSTHTPGNTRKNYQTAPENPSWAISFNPQAILDV